MHNHSVPFMGHFLFLPSRPIMTFFSGNRCYHINKQRKGLIKCRQ